MDHVNNRPTNLASPSLTAENAPTHDTHLQEEPEYIARYMVIKHSWRGKYKRILCISPASIITLDPSTLNVTNSYDVTTDFETAAPVIGRDDPQPQHAQEFIINVRTDGRGKFKAIKFSSRLFLLYQYFPSSWKYGTITVLGDNCSSKLLLFSFKGLDFAN
ncbi:hypothetical protein L7F22_049274 [Adiantum nelumboides]|nr:hypothetical protein [Adiantum nelumboides]